jgi:hypothetical protein
MECKDYRIVQHMVGVDYDCIMNQLGPVHYPAPEVCPGILVYCARCDTETTKDRHVSYGVLNKLLHRFFNVDEERTFLFKVVGFIDGSIAPTVYCCITSVKSFTYVERKNMVKRYDCLIDRFVPDDGLFFAYGNVVPIGVFEF